MEQPLRLWFPGISLPGDLCRTSSHQPCLAMPLAKHVLPLLHWQCALWWYQLRKRDGFNVGSFDLKFGEEKGRPRAHDFLSSAGFLSYSQWLDWCDMWSVWVYSWCVRLCMCIRVACFGALQVLRGCLALIAPDCRSWGSPARGSSWRSGINVLGVGYPFVLDGNKTASRWLESIWYIAVLCAVACPWLQTYSLHLFCNGLNSLGLLWYASWSSVCMVTLLWSNHDWVYSLDIIDGSGFKNVFAGYLWHACSVGPCMHMHGGGCISFFMPSGIWGGFLAHEVRMSFTEKAPASKQLETHC